MHGHHTDGQFNYFIAKNRKLNRELHIICVDNNGQCNYFIAKKQGIKSHSKDRYSQQSA